eukprot:scaffold16169_cov108-Cylindrotheca_fusiformis.AAC.1
MSPEDYIIAISVIHCRIQFSATFDAPLPPFLEGCNRKEYIAEKSPSPKVASDLESGPLKEQDISMAPFPVMVYARNSMVR